MTIDATLSPATKTIFCCTACLESFDLPESLSECLTCGALACMHSDCPCPISDEDQLEWDAMVAREAAVLVLG
jgi:hypothetical protein